MASRFSIFPKAFLFFFPLHLGAELITAVGVLNKASGFYGILSIFTGHPLDAMEWILNIMSLILLPIYAIAFLTVTQRNGLQMVLFSYLYTIDTFISSIGFSIYFIVHWFKTKAHEMAANGSQGTNTIASSASSISASASTIPPTASPSLESIASLAERAISSTPTTASAAAAAATATGVDINKSATLAQETSLSIVLTVGLMLVRLYFTLCILSYARMLVRQQNLRPHNGSPKGSLRAKLQYYALSFCESFWTGYDSGYTNSAASSMSSPLSSNSNSNSSITLNNGASKESEATTRLNTDFDNE